MLCEMTDRQAEWEEGLSKHIKKHFRDVYRLSRIIPPTEKVTITGMVKTDMERFISGILSSGIQSDDINRQEMYDLLSFIYIS